MAQQVVIAGAMFNDVPAISVPDSNNVYHSFTDVSDTTAAAADVASGKYFYTSAGVRTAGTSSGGGGDPWSWMGKNPTFVKNLVNTKVYLKDSPWATWTPSTTATSLITDSNLTQESLNVGNYDNHCQLKFHTHFEYGSGATGKAQIDDYYYTQTYTVFGSQSSLSNMTNDVITTVQGTSVPLRHGLFYKSTTGIDTFKVSVSCGLYIASWTGQSSLGTVSSGTSNVVFTTPRIYARCNNNYLTTNNAGAVDQNNSYYELVMELWKSDRGTSMAGGQVKTFRDMWLDGDII